MKSAATEPLSEALIIGSWNERFSYTDEDIDAYLTWASQEGYEHIILAGHSLGANKMIYYLVRSHDPRVEHFFLLSPANLTYMMSGVTAWEKQMIRDQVERGDVRLDVLSSVQVHITEKYSSMPSRLKQGSR